MAYSYVEYTSTGSTGPFSITFGYLEADHVTAYEAGVEVDFTWLTASTVELDSAPAVGATIRFQRTTPKDSRTVNFQDAGTLTEEDLDDSALQNFYISQEAADDAEDSLIKGDDGNYDADSGKITNLADPTAAQDAVTKAHLEAFALAASTHSHDNKTLLDGIEADEVHSHDNKALLDTYDQTNTDLTNAVAHKDVSSGNPHSVTAAEAGAAAAGIATEFTKTQNFDESALTPAAAVSWDCESNQVCTLTLDQNTTLNAPTNQKAGAFYCLTVIQDSSDRTLAFNAVFDFGAVGTPDTPSGSGSKLIMIFKSDGTNMLMVGKWEESS